MATNPHSIVDKSGAAGGSITGISDGGVFDPTEFSAKSTPIAADKVVIQDTADDDAPKVVTMANMAVFHRAIAQMPADIASSLFFLAKEFDFSGAATLIATKISDHAGATALAAKGKLIAAIVAVTQVANGTTTDVISIAKDGTPTAKLCSDLTITIADVTNKVGCAFMLMPVSGANAIVDPASEDIYAVAAASSGRSAGKVYVLLVFQKTA